MATRAKAGTTIAAKKVTRTSAAKAATTKKAKPTKKAAPKSATPKSATSKRATSKTAATKTAKSATSKSATSKRATSKTAATKQPAANAATKQPARAKPATKPTPSPTRVQRIAARAGRPAPAAPPSPSTAPPTTEPTAPVEAPPLVGIPSPAAARHRLLVDGERFGAATLALRPLPPLRLTTGAIVTCDPFEATGPTLARRLRPGSYDVAAAVATYPGKHGPGEQLLAAVLVKLADAPPTAWEPAAFAGEAEAADPAYPTSSGAGCFMDARVQAALAAEPTTFPTASYRALERQLLDEHHQPTWGWASYTPEAAAPAGCVAFLGGATDARRSYWGTDDRGHVVCLLTDLEIFPADAWQ